MTTPVKITEKTDENIKLSVPKGPADGNDWSEVSVPSEAFPDTAQVGDWFKVSPSSVQKLTDSEIPSKPFLFTGE